MTPEHFLQLLQHQTSSFAQTVSTNEGEWIIKGFIDIHKKVYTISIDILSIVFYLERTNQLSLLPDKDLVDLCPPIEP